MADLQVPWFWHFLISNFLLWFTEYLLKISSFYFAAIYLVICRRVIHLKFTTWKTKIYQQLHRIFFLFQMLLFLLSFLALLSIKHSHTIYTTDTGITFRHDLVYYSLSQCLSVIKFIFLCKLYNNVIPVENDKLLHKYLNLIHTYFKTFCGNAECQK